MTWGGFLDDAGVAAAVGIPPALMLDDDPVTRAAATRMAQAAAKHQTDLMMAHARAVGVHVANGIATLFGGKRGG